jgi:hypothetical protein
MEFWQGANIACTTAFYTSATTVAGKSTDWRRNPRNLLF